MKLMTLWLVMVCVCFAQQSLEMVHAYNPATSNYALPPVVVVVNQLDQSVSDQKVLNQLKAKLGYSPLNDSLQSFIASLVNKQYQVVWMSFRSAHQIKAQTNIRAHQLFQYPVRQSMRRLNPERKILAAGFRALDQFVMSEQYWRPMCIIIELPMAEIYQLDEMRIANNESMAQKRDFALVNVYHELHKRIYLNQSRVIIYSTIDENRAFN